MINEEVTAKAETDSTLASFLELLKTGIADFSKLIENRMEWQITCKTTWEKLILVVYLDEPNFERKLRLLVLLDDVIRFRFRSQSSNQYDYSELIKGFFIKIDPSL